MPRAESRCQTVGMFCGKRSFRLFKRIIPKARQHWSDIISLIRNPNAKSPTQANLMQVCESTEIIYERGVINF
jgi:hypothetical protein